MEEGLTIGYSRQSRAVAEESLKNRRQQIEAIAEQHHLSIGVWIEENNESSTDSERAGLKRLEEMIVSGQVRTVVMTERSRLGRGDPEYWGRLIKLFKLFGVCIISRDGVQDYAKRGASTLAPEIIDAVNREQKRQFSERVKAAGLARLLNGGPGNGSAPYGYRHDRSQPHAYAPVPDEYEVLQEILNRALSESACSIVRDLNSRGIPSPSGKIWHASAIRSICENSFYAGYRQQRREVFDGAVFRLEAPIMAEKAGPWICPITLDHHARLQAILHKRHKFPDGEMAMLRRILLCCRGDVMHGFGVAYACDCKHASQKHPGIMIMKRYIEEWVLSSVWLLLRRIPETLKADPIPQDGTGYKEARTAYEAARRELVSAQQMTPIQRSFMAPGRYEEMLCLVQSQADTARKEMERLQGQLTAPDIAGALDEARMARARGEAAWMDPEARIEGVRAYHATLRAFIKRVQLQPFEEGQHLHIKGKVPTIEWQPWCTRYVPRTLPEWPVLKRPHKHRD